MLRRSSSGSGSRSPGSSVRAYQRVRHLPNRTNGHRPACRLRSQVSGCRRLSRPFSPFRTKPPSQAPRLHPTPRPYHAPRPCHHARAQRVHRNPWPITGMVHTHASTGLTGRVDVGVRTRCAVKHEFVVLPLIYDAVTTVFTRETMTLAPDSCIAAGSGRIGRTRRCGGWWRSRRSAAGAGLLSRAHAGPPAWRRPRC